MTDLKACPFCGGESVMKQLSSNPRFADFQAVCIDPDCRGGKYLEVGYESADGAADAWDTRRGER